MIFWSLVMAGVLCCGQQTPSVRLSPDFYTSGQVQRRSPGRRICRVQATGRRSHWRCATPCLLLGPHAAALLRLLCLHEIAACRRGAGAHPRALRDRGRHPRSPRRPPKAGAAGAKSTDVEALHRWLQDHVGRVSAVSDLAKAIRYAIPHWPGLVVFLDDGRVEMDTNVVERAIRPHTLMRPVRECA